MIQAIKIDVFNEEGLSRELSFEYEEDGDRVNIYLGDKFICSTDYNENFKKSVEHILEKW